jgi:endonuclease/exonuclease/phosphatase family metal-dependent hydrolase
MVSRIPIEDWSVVRLASAPVRSPVAVPGGRGRFVLLPDEPRVGLAGRLPDGRLLATTHLSFVPAYNLAQLRRLTTALARMAPSCLLLGDLNVPRPLPEWATGWRSLAHVRTYPAESPFVQVDHVLSTRPAPPVRSVEVRRLPLSDHRALIVEVGE